MLEDSTCNIHPGSTEYNVLKNTDVVIWDEAPMAPKSALQAIDITLRDIMSNDIPFGGKLMILGGDHRQILPVVKHGNRRTQIQATIKMSRLWPKFTVILLHENMRTGPTEKAFSDWLLQLGDGELPHDNDDQIDIPTECQSNGDLINETFGDKLNNPGDSSLQHYAILTPKNEDAFKLNDQIIDAIPGQAIIFKSIDEAVCNSDEDSTNYPMEFLNKLAPTGLPLHKLKLKTNAIVMLLRNLSVENGLCNGTRLMIKEIKKYLLVCTILTGSKQVILRRRQFPIRLAYVITINKGQGQTFNQIGLYLPEPVFTHGQLYVAFSRVRNPKSIKVFIGSGETKTKNIVFKEILT